jgi:murein DD-endopeptidase MepM/ murein hydrolase activator NlpD
MQQLTKKQPKAISPVVSPDNSPVLTHKYSVLSLPTGLDFKQGIYGLYPWLTKFINNDPQFKRTCTHVVVALVITLALVLSNLNIFDPAQTVIRPLTQNVEPILFNLPINQEEITVLTLPTRLNNFLDGVFSRAAVPRTTTLDQIQETTEVAEVFQTQRSNEITTYVVEPGDTIYGIAAGFGLAPETIMWANESIGNNPHFLSVGQELIILPVDGLYHQVGGGDTIEGIASTFRTDPANIINNPLNQLDPANPIIVPGQWLLVPGGTRPFIPRTVTAYTGEIPDDALAGTGAFNWPTTGEIYQGYWSGHPAIDIASDVGDPVMAADAGYVIAAGWDNTGYGYSVVIDHGNGFQTLYAHLQAYYVEAGQNISQGQQIGEVGTSGNSTGPHLHLEVRQGTVQLNPTGFLP